MYSTPRFPFYSRRRKFALSAERNAFIFFFFLFPRPTAAFGKWMASPRVRSFIHASLINESSRIRSCELSDGRLSLQWQLRSLSARLDDREGIPKDILDVSLSWHPLTSSSFSARCSTLHLFYFLFSSTKLFSKNQFWTSREPLSHRYKCFRNFTWILQLVLRSRFFAKCKILTLYCL